MQIFELFLDCGGLAAALADETAQTNQQEAQPLRKRVITDLSQPNNKRLLRPGAISSFPPFLLIPPATRLHLPHGMAAMYLDCDFASPQLKSDLLIQHP